MMRAVSINAPPPLENAALGARDRLTTCITTSTSGTLKRMIPIFVELSVRDRNAEAHILVFPGADREGADGARQKLGG